MSEPTRSKPTGVHRLILYGLIVVLAIIGWYVVNWVVAIS